MCYDGGMSKEEIVKVIAEKVKDHGGRVFYVGGCVRDRLSGIDNTDIDIEVHGVSPETLYSVLGEVGEPLSFGDSFGVYSLKGYDIDIAMPRKETAIGKGHRDFDVIVDPFIGIKNAARRRDFTVNAMMEDVLTGQIEDPFHGQEDLQNKILRHIDPKTFVEDPLRVLRAAQFASRFGFTVDKETVELCKSIDLSTLTKERVEGELKKALTKGKRPSVFFEVLKEMDQLSFWFPEVLKLDEIPQDPLYHPEGNVYVHTMEVIDRAADFRELASDPYHFGMLCLCHDFGKIVTTFEKDGHIHAYNHEKEGVPIIRTFIKRITDNKDVMNYVINMVPLHMKPNAVAHAKSPVKTTNKMFDQAIAPLDLVLFSSCDKCIYIEGEKFTGDHEFLLERLEIYEEMMHRPYVGGHDLILAGLEPGEDFKDILEYAHKLRLAGIEKENALKQTLAYAEKKRKRS